MHTKTTFLLLFLFIIFLPHSYGLDMIEDLLSPDADYTKLFPQTIILKGFGHTYNCEISGPMEIIIQKNPQTKQLDFKVSSTITNAQMIYDKNLNVLKSETHFLETLEDLIRKTGHDIRKYYRQNNGNEPDDIVLTFFLGGKKQKSKVFSCDRNTFPSDAVMMMCKAVLFNGIRKGFLFDIISLEDFVKARMKMEYYFTDNVLSLSEDFPFPQKVNEAIRPDEKYHVFKMKVHGLLGLFIRSSWFFVFKAEYPYGFVAYWGGDGIYREIMFFVKDEYVYDDK